MNKKEIAEIKKLYGIKDCSISRIAGCYVDGEGDIKATFAENFLTLPEEEIYKYLEFFKKGLTGQKNLTTTEFPAECEGANTMHEMLLKIRDTKLKNEDILQRFYDIVIESYQNEAQNYLILLMCNTYDIPGRGDDNFKNPDASDEIYDYITFYICPVSLEDGGLTYDSREQKFVHKERRWCVDMPCYSFLFPSFEDRSTDIHNVTIYTKKTDGRFDEFSKAILGMEPNMAPDAQKYTFQSIVETAIQDEEAALEVVTAINVAIAERISNAIPGEKVFLDSKLLKDIVEESGMSKTSCNILEQELKSKLGKRMLCAENIVDKKTMQVKSPDVVIKINNDLAEKVSVKTIDSINYIIVPINTGDDVEVNGISLH